MKRSWRFYAGCLSFACFIASLFMPALKLLRADDIMGWVALLFGWAGTLSLNIGWFANFAYAFAWLSVLLRWRVVAIISCLAALVVGMDSRAMVGLTVPLDEANVNKATVVAMGPGFYVWMLSFALLFAAAWPERKSKVEECSPDAKP